MHLLIKAIGSKGLHNYKMGTNDIKYCDTYCEITHLDLRNDDVLTKSLKCYGECTDWLRTRCNYGYIYNIEGKLCIPCEYGCSNADLDIRELSCKILCNVVKSSTSAIHLDETIIPTEEIEISINTRAEVVIGVIIGLVVVAIILGVLLHRHMRNLAARRANDNFEQYSMENINPGFSNSSSILSTNTNQNGGENTIITNDSVYLNNQRTFQLDEINRTHLEDAKTVLEVAPMPSANLEPESSTSSQSSEDPRSSIEQDAQCLLECSNQKEENLKSSCLEKSDIISPNNENSKQVNNVTNDCLSNDILQEHISSSSSDSTYSLDSLYYFYCYQKKTDNGEMGVVITDKPDDIEQTITDEIAQFPMKCGDRCVVHQTIRKLSLSNVPFQRILSNGHHIRVYCDETNVDFINRKGTNLGLTKDQLECVVTKPCFGYSYTEP